ncbi:MAG: hypothetical protein QW128_05530 [Thermoprotei archaeon]
MVELEEYKVNGDSSPRPKSEAFSPKEWVKNFTLIVKKIHKIIRKVI